MTIMEGAHKVIISYNCINTAFCTYEILYYTASATKNILANTIINNENYCLKSIMVLVLPILFRDSIGIGIGNTFLPKY